MIKQTNARRLDVINVEIANQANGAGTPQ